MPGLRICPVCKGMDYEKKLIQLNGEWVHPECKKKRQLQLACEEIGDQEKEYKYHVLGRAKGENILWLDDGQRLIEDNEILLRREWVKEVFKEQENIYLYLKDEVDGYDEIEKVNSKVKRQWNRKWEQKSLKC